MKRYLTLGFALALAWPLFAASPVRIKIDLDGRSEGIILKEVKTAGILRADHPSWEKDAARRSCYLIIGSRSDLPAGEWRDYEFSFVPDKSGTVRILIRGGHTGKQVVRWIGYDDFRVEGMAWQNPGFETLAGNRIADWRSSSGANFRIGRADAPEGRNYVECAHDFYLERQAGVEGGKTVTVRFKARGGAELPRAEVNKLAVPAAAVAKAPAKPDHPKAYYRYYDSKVKLLPLKDKGISPAEVAVTPGARRPDPAPLPVFAVPDGRTAPAVDFERVSVELLEEGGVARTAPIRFGLPVPEKTLYHLDNLRVRSPEGKPVPAQFAATGFWPDRSIAWVLVQFDAPLAAGERALYRVEYGRQVKPDRFASPLRYEENADAITVSTGRLKAVIDKKRFNLLRAVELDGQPAGGFTEAGLLLTDETGGEHPSSAVPPRRITGLEAGPRHLSFRIEGSYGTEKIGSYVARIAFAADSARVELELTHLNDNLAAEFTDITSLTAAFRPARPATRLSMDEFVLDRPGRIFQQDDKILALPGRQAEARLTGAGSAEIAGGGTLGIHLRHAALRYPKAFALTPETIEFELLPPLPDAQFGTKLPHYLQFPFCEGKYRLKWGMSFTENLTLDFAASDPAALAAPEVVPVIDRDYLYKCRVFQGVAPKGDDMFPDWDRQALDAFRRHLKIKEKQREYGFLNYGDWYGERGRNWTNNEYDMAHGLFMLFARTGDRDVFRLAALAARHQADVDIIHAYPDPAYVGANAQHGIGHTGVSYQRINPATWSHKLDISYKGTNGHTWSEGMLEAWVLAGDARTMESALLLGEHLVNDTAPNFKRLGTHERSAGWSLKAIVAYYRTLGDRRYLDAANRIADIAMKEQNFARGGAWPHKLPQDHAGGHADTFGNCPYLIGVLTEGLRQLYLTAPRPELARSLIAASNWQLSAWDEKSLAWPYGAAWDGKPYNPPAPGLNLLVAPGLLTGGRLGNNPASFEVAKKVMAYSTLRGLSAIGKALSIELCLVPGLMDELHRFPLEHPGAEPYRYDELALVRMLNAGAAREFRLRAPDRKEFELFLTADRPEIEVVRTRHGSRPDSKPECNFEILDPAGRIVAAETLPTKRPFTGRYRLDGKAGDRFLVRIDDDMTAVWHIAAAPGVAAFARLAADSTVAVGSIGGYFLTVPAGVRKFGVQLTGIHEGGYRAWLLGPDGKVAAEAVGVNDGGPRLPWLENRRDPRAVQTMTVERPAGAGREIYQLLITFRGDIGLRFDGIPAVIGVEPMPWPGQP